MAGADFGAPLLRAPGCLPPLIAPLNLSRFLSGSATDVRDSSCAGTLGTFVVPLNTVALPGATAWAAINVTPKIVAAAPLAYTAGDRARYQLVLGPTQSQVSATLVKGPSLVSVELGFSELVGAATSGRLVQAVSYTQAVPYTFIPASVFAPTYSAVVDSIKQTGARVVLLSIPHVTRLYGLRPASELWDARAELAALGVAVAGDCNGSPNIVFTPALVPRLAAQAIATGASQALSCADVPDSADAVLTPADVTVLNTAADAMNSQIRQLATANGWAFADLDAVFTDLSSGRAPYRAATELSCLYPYGAFISLDGIHPSAAGQQSIANAVASALNATYGFAIPLPVVLPIAAAQLCP
jgi:hypothetical protein